MNIKTIILLTIITFATALATIPQYEVIDLGTADLDYGSLHVSSINDKGQIVGVYNDFVSHDCLPIMFDPSGSGHIEFLNDQLFGYISINNNGQIVGTAGSPSRAAVIDLNSPERFFILDTSRNYDSSSALAINDHGLVAGSVGVNDTLSSAIFDYNNPGSVTVLPNTSEFSKPFSRSINDNGQIVGYVSDGMNLFFRF